MNTDWLDERIRLGEIPPHARTQAHERTASPEGSLAQEVLATSDADLLRRLPPERFAAKLEARRARPSLRVPSWPRLGSAILATACILVLALVLSQRAEDPGEPAPVVGRDPVPQRRDSPPPPATAMPAPDAPERVALAPDGAPDDGIRIRGDRKLSLLVVSPDGADPVGPAGLAAGSVLRIAAPQAAHAAVFSLDETGMLQRHWPLRGDSSASLPAGPLPNDWETDPTPGWERFVLVTGETGFALRAVETQLRGLRASGDPARRRITLPGGLSVTDTLLERRVR